MGDKTLADVADKAVDKIADGASHLTAEAGKILDGLGQMAPHAWEVSVRQQVLEAWAGIAGWCTFGLVLLGLGLFLLRRSKATRDNEARQVLYAFGIVAIIVSTIPTLISLGFNTPRLLNPEYYAAKEVLCKTTGKACDD